MRVRDRAQRCGLVIVIFLTLVMGSSLLPAACGQQGSSSKAQQNELIDKAIAREKETIRVIREGAPVVETYIQNMRPDPVMREIPESDQHFLGRVDFRNVIDYTAYKRDRRPNEKSDKRSLVGDTIYFVEGLHTIHTEFSPAGFVQMLLMDSNDFDRQHYRFRYVRGGNLGAVPTAVFDVFPLGGKKAATGRFFGRIWIETAKGNVIRLNGEFASSQKNYHDFFHFDSWRTNVQPDLWLPTSVYVEETDAKSGTGTLKFKAVTNVWGYSLKAPVAGAESTSIEVQGATDISKDAKDVSPLAASRAFTQQAEDNVLDRLYQAGLLDAPGEFDQTLEAIANKIPTYSGQELASPIRVRTLLTQPLESFAIGNTIVLSKGLIDSTAVLTKDGAQQLGNINAILAFQVAHILSGHQLDTKYAFNDRLLFPNDAVLQRLQMQHSDADNAEAALKCMQLLQPKELADSQRFFGLYLRQLKERQKSLRALDEPLLGDGLVKSEVDGTFWLDALLPKAEEIRNKDLEQRAAAPLAGFVKFDAWTDGVMKMPTSFEPLLSPSDKLPFEIKPVYLDLSYFGTSPKR